MAKEKDGSSGQLKSKTEPLELWKSQFKGLNLYMRSMVYSYFAGLATFLPLITTFSNFT